MAIPMYLDMHPLHDYEPIGRENGAWIGSSRDHDRHPLVMVRKVYQMSIAHLQALAQVKHPNISRPVALYVVGEDLYPVYDFEELDISDLPSLPCPQVATILAQVRLYSTWVDP
jgi:hypothetical protein